MAKKALGKGLGALLSSSMAEEDAAGVHEIPIRYIRPDPYQPRNPIDPASVAELAELIKAHGVIQPLIVKRVAVILTSSSLARGGCGRRMRPG